MLSESTDVQIVITNHLRSLDGNEPQVIYLHLIDEHFNLYKGACKEHLHVAAERANFDVLSIGEKVAEIQRRRISMTSRIVRG